MAKSKSKSTPKKPRLPRLSAADKRRLEWLDGIHREVVPLAVQKNIHPAVIDESTKPTMIALLQEGLGRSIAAVEGVTRMDQFRHRILDSEESFDLLATHSAFAHLRMLYRRDPQALATLWETCPDEEVEVARCLLLGVWDMLGPRPDHNPPRRQAQAAALPPRSAA